ncbi:hypothetical protein Acr_03g0015310 [Actinidia rufa]|uniref:Glycosyltransferase n=1 Tax=Actinidia rufa TaxID=165716 RepID=A0A7J0EGI8_9ERIC|nr:hypothetical protein Acr_03g0015310 [Actinidia rufa]
MNKLKSWYSWCLFHSRAISTNSSTSPASSRPTTSPSTTPAQPPTFTKPSSGSSTRTCISATPQLLSCARSLPRQEESLSSTMSLWLMWSKTLLLLPNAESYVFQPTSAFSSFFDVWQLNGEPFLEEKEPEGLPSIEGCYTFKILNFIALQIEYLKFKAGSIYNSCRSIEGNYIDLGAKQDHNTNAQAWAIGPLNLGTAYERRNSNSQHKCMEWLDKQAPKSVLYVSFGTTTSMTDEQIKELAKGLEQSKQKFIWCLRDADRGDIFTGDVKIRNQLPEEYEVRVKEVGMVVRDWAPQVEILGHPSTGAFMSHCGWNSCLESITMGVPIAAWPMHSDQPKNAFLLIDILKVGLVVNRWEHRDELVTSTTIAEAVTRLMASKEGEELRKRAEELGVATRKSVEEGGVSRMELDSFVAHITRKDLVLPQE